MTSPDLTQANIDKLAELFPNVVTETRDADGAVKRAIDFDALRQELSDHIVEGPQERYQLDWPGKRAAAFAANAPIAKTLRPMREESVDFDATKNLFIEGDNLDALKLLQESYLGKVKLIYIDPPYNTGNDFVYNDDFAATTKDYLDRSGQVDNAGARLTANSETNGRFHSDWLSMMSPRLKLARNLLSEDGAIFMSIDDAEMGNLHRLAAEVFGEHNFVGAMVWAAGRKNDSKYISSSHEYILIFARDISSLDSRVGAWRTRKEGLDEIYAEYGRLRRAHGEDNAAVASGLRAWYRQLGEDDPAKRHKHYSSVDERGVFFPSDLSKNSPTSRSKYDVFHPVTGKAVSMPEHGWRYAPEQMATLLAENRIKFGPDETTRPTYKRYLSDAEDEIPYSVFYVDGRGASGRLKSLLGGAVFDNPKDEHVLRKIVEFGTSKDDLILDFFAGSGTSAHAVMLQNAKDGGSRKYILVQLDEIPATHSNAAREGYRTIAEVSRERVRRAGKKVNMERAADTAPLDTGFRALRIDTTNMADVLRTPDETNQLDLGERTSSIKRDRTREDLLFQVLLDWGLELTLPIRREQIDGREVFVVDDGGLIACFDESVTPAVVRAIAERQPVRAVFRDDAFATDAERINAEQVFAEVSPDTSVKAI
ncbi:site-specific DNA-methyltransferase [Microbacterium stercoris]|nr:site-specific DNA-methyltransferase [Microbacterium stercoris]